MAACSARCARCSARCVALVLPAGAGVGSGSVPVPVPVRRCPLRGRGPCELSSSLDVFKILKFYKIFYHSESLNAYLKY